MRSMFPRSWPRWLAAASTPSELSPIHQSRPADDEGQADEDPDDLVIAEGGAAATAYARLQFEDMKPETRDKINAALLRYCELDTLAMVMIVQGWKDLAR